MIHEYEKQVLQILHQKNLNVPVTLLVNHQLFFSFCICTVIYVKVYVCICVFQGVLCATPLIFIIPSACFLKVSSGRWFQMKKLMPTLILIAGVFVMTIGLIMTGLSPQDCSHGVEMFYCTDLNSSASLTMTPASSVLSIINSTRNISIF